MRPTITIGVLLALSLIRPGTPNTQQTGNRSVNTAPAAPGVSGSQKEEPKDARTFLCHYFDLEESDETKCQADLKKAFQWQMLIATVPDPKRTHLALYFDRIVEAL